MGMNMALRDHPTLVKPRIAPSAVGQRGLLRLRRCVARLEDELYQMDRRVLFLLLLALEVAIFWVDLNTEPTLIVAPYYLVPIIFSAWFLERRITYLLLTLAVLARVYAYWDMFPKTTHFLYWHNLLTTACAYSLVEVLIWRVKQLVTRLALHADYLQQRGRNVGRRRRLQATIRRAVPADAAAILRLIALGAEDGAFSRNALYEARQQELAVLITHSITEGNGTRDLWQGGRTSVPMEYWVSEIDGVVAGYIMVIGVDAKKDADRELHAIAVAHSHRGIGIGSALTSFFCAHFKQRRLIVACKPRSRMMTMMERRGFRQYASAQGYSLLEKLP